MAALSQAVAGGLEVAAAALRGDDSSSSSHAEPEQRFAGFGALESVPDLKQGTSAWKRVRTPTQLGGKELRICQTGARLFIELDDEAIPPIAHFMRTKNANQKSAVRALRSRFVTQMTTTERALHSRNGWGFAAGGGGDSPPDNFLAVPR